MRSSVVVVAVLVSLWGVSRAQRPNIIVVLVDDLGFNDLGIQGSPDVESPNIDQLMRDGVIFDNTYSCAGFCSPARAGLITGKHPFHIGHYYNPPHDFEDTNAGLPHGHTILPKQLKESGYKSIAIGKWHLGYTFKHHAMKLGFDHFFGFLGGKFNYTSTVHTLDIGYEQYLYDDWNKWEDTTYLTDDWTDKAIDFLTENKDERMFIYLAYNTVHDPYLAKPEDMEYFAHIPEERRVHVAMIKNLDDNIKRLRDHIESLGIAKDTAIIFTNDNGGHKFGSVNEPFRDYKATLWEGGVRVPLSITWPRKIRKNRRTPMLASIIDIFPTCQAMAGQEVNPDVEGVNLLPYVIQKPNTEPDLPVDKERAIINRRPLGNGTVRKGDWKIFFNNNGSIKGLWNLTADPGESNDLQGQHPEVEAELTALFQEWDALTAPEFFPPGFGKNNFIVPNPMTLDLVLSPATIQVGDTVRFKAQGTHEQGTKIIYRWTVFDPDQETFVYYNNYKSHPGVSIAKRYNRITDITFSAPGTLIVQIRAYDGRFVKIINTEYTVEAAR